MFTLLIWTIQRPDRRLFSNLPTGNLADIMLKHCTLVAFYESDAKLPLLLAYDNKLRLKGAPLIDMFLECL